MQRVTYALLAATAVAAADDKASPKCQALAMSGGGTLGAYEAGALWGMYYGLSDKTHLQYDVVTGVSAGSINLGLVSVYEKGDEEAMVKDLSSRWANLKQDNLYVDWPLGKVSGVTHKSGLVNTQPLTDYLDNFFNEHGRSFKRQFVVSSVDVNTGNYMTYDNSEKEVSKAITSSASIPFIFPNQKWADGHVAMDGGTVWNLNMISAIKKCREMGHADDAITVDIIVCSAGKKLAPWSMKEDTMSNWMRYDQIKQYHQGNQDIYDVMHAYPKVNYRYYVEPSGQLASGLDIIKVDNATVTWPAQAMGRKDGDRVVKAGEGKLFNDFKDRMDSKQQGPAKKPEGTLDLEFLQK